jgi:multimeric flavodoxin WrbA
MKITCLLGSPRANGNSAVLAQHLCDTAKGLGATVQTFSLNKLNFRGCQGCLACKTKTDRCVVQDDLTEVLESVREGDGLVLATPVYMGGATCTLRAFIERTYSFLVPDFLTNPNPSRLAPGKKLAFIQVQGQPSEKMYADIYPGIEPFFKRYGFETHLLRALGVRKPGEVASRTEMMKAVEETAKKMVER